MKTQSLNHSYLKYIPHDKHCHVAAHDRTSSERQHLQTVNHLQHKFNPAFVHGTGLVPRADRTAVKKANREAIKKAMSQTMVGKHCPTLFH